MIRVNLLPFRAARKKDNVKKQVSVYLLAIVVCICGLLVFNANLGKKTRRLADRIVAVQMVVDGADFIELYRWFLDRTHDAEQAFESTRRIFRGSPVTGGAPFTKDCAYLSGFLSVSTFIRSAFTAGRSDTLALLFSGKLDLFAVPALGELRAQGLVQPARFLPPWALDPSWVLSYLTLNTFMSHIDLTAVTDAMSDVLAHCPRVEVNTATG